MAGWDADTDAYPLRTDGTILLLFRRVFILARKD